MNRLLIFILMLAALLFPLTAAALTLFKGNVPAAAERIADELDDQLMARYTNPNAKNTSESQTLARSQILVMGTTPTNINNLDTSCPLARQMTEEISTRFMENGYRYQELRKGKFIRFDRNSGEFLLSRNTRNLTSQTGTGQVILAGTYIITSKQVRFSMSLIHTLSNEVIAKASASVPITPDLVELIEEDRKIGKQSGDKRFSTRVPNTYTPLQ